MAIPCNGRGAKQIRALYNNAIRLRRQCERQHKIKLCTKAEQIFGKIDVWEQRCRTHIAPRRRTKLWFT